jgi:hypothetical protein
LVIRNLPLGERTYGLLLAYQELEGRGAIPPDAYLFARYREDRNSINAMMGILMQRKQNSAHLTTRVNLQKVIRSRIFLDLIASEGRDLMLFYSIMGLKKDTQLTSAIQEYLVFVQSRLDG